MSPSTKSRSTKKPAAAGFELARQPKMEVLGVKIRFVLITKNGLRKVIFELEKTTEGDKDKWKILFQLFEREKKTDEFELVVELVVEVDIKLNPKAQLIFDNERMSAKQTAYAIGPGAQKAKDPNKPKAKKAVQDTLNK